MIGVLSALLLSLIPLVVLWRVDHWLRDCEPIVFEKGNLYVSLCVRDEFTGSLREIAERQPVTFENGTNKDEIRWKIGRKE